MQVLVTVTQTDVRLELFRFLEQKTALFVLEDVSSAVLQIPTSVSIVGREGSSTQATHLHLVICAQLAANHVQQRPQIAKVANLVTLLLPPLAK